MESLAIVCTFFDGYYDLWIDFLRLLAMYWADCPYPLFIVNNTRDINPKDLGDAISCESVANMKLLHSGEDAEYSRKLQIAVDEIKADRYLMLLEDFFIGDKVNTKVIEDIINFIKNENIRYYQMPLPEFCFVKSLNRYKGCEAVYQMSPHSEYTVSCQPSIWERKFLKQCIGTTNYNAWVFEGMYARSSKTHTEEFLDGCVLDSRNPLNLWHGVRQGGFLPSTHQHFAKRGYTFFNEREVLKRSQVAKHEAKKFVKRYMPGSAQRLMKRALPGNSVLDRYKEDIDRQIELVIDQTSFSRYEGSCN